jgi:hypothetical protein
MRISEVREEELLTHSMDTSSYRITLNLQLNEDLAKSKQGGDIYNLQGKKVGITSKCSRVFATRVCPCSISELLSAEPKCSKQIVCNLIKEGPLLLPSGLISREDSV